MAEQNCVGEVWVDCYSDFGFEGFCHSDCEPVGECTEMHVEQERSKRARPGVLTAPGPD